MSKQPIIMWTGRPSQYDKLEFYSWGVEVSWRRRRWWQFWKPLYEEVYREID